MNAFKNADGKSIVLAMIKAIQNNRDYLGEIDGLIGDGDHGMNMNKGFSMCEKSIMDEDLSFSECLDRLGDILITEIGGSMGPIYGTIFMDMADSAQDAIDGKVFSQMLNAGRDGLFEIIEARVGDKTLVDVLAPACDTFEEAVKSGDDFAQALRKMKEAAKAGMESTRELVAKFGRSSRLGERSKGVLDAGAASCNIILQAMADEMLNILNK
jgi:dihydroxyacetone kinase-like protein